MIFANWPFLLLLLLPLVLHRLWMNRNRPARLNFPLPVPSSISVVNPTRSMLLFRYIVFIFLAIALARPQSVQYQLDSSVEGVDIVLVMDVSASMNIEDMADRSRFEVAKDTMRDFIRGRHNDRIGFVIFSGEAYTFVPPTLDYGLLLENIGQAEVGVLKDGTAIGDGLAVAVDRLRQSKAKSRIVILLTDGDNNVGSIDPGTAGDLAAGYAIKVYTIAIGREGRVKIPIYRKTNKGRVRVGHQWQENALNPELLQKISSLTGGKFYRATDEKALDKVFKEIDQLEKSKIETKKTAQYHEQFQTPLKIAFFLLLMERVLSLFLWRVYP